MLTPKQEKDISEKILLIAHKHFSVHGFAGARMQAIADEASVNKALLHYYFKNKQGLFHEVFKRDISETASSILEILNSNAPIFKKIGYLIEDSIRKIFTSYDIHILLEGDLQMTRKEEEEIAAIMCPVMKRYEEVVQEAIRKKEIRNISAADLILDIRSLTSALAGEKKRIMYMMQLSEEGFADWVEQRKKHITRLIIEGIQK
jgi:TetR/AcrR family transcriptional regulator